MSIRKKESLVVNAFIKCEERKIIDFFYKGYNCLIEIKNLIRKEVLKNAIQGRESRKERRYA